MAHRGYKVVACIPAGRKRTMEPLVQHINAQRPLVDGLMIWKNTKNLQDLAYIDSLNDEFTQVMPLDDMQEFRTPLQTNTGRFYLNCTDHDTIYIRFDDDIVYIHEDAIRNLVDFRIDNPDPFVVFPVIWNNAVAMSYQQEAGHVDERHGRVARYCMDQVGWSNPEFAVYIHKVLLDHIAAESVPKLFVDHVELTNWLRFSVSCFAWFGKDWATFRGHTVKGVEPVASQLWKVEEEHGVTEYMPRQVNRFNWICGNSIVSHYSFFKQRIGPKGLDNTDILDQYREIAQRKLHDKYYDLIEVANQELPPFEPKPWWERDNVWRRIKDGKNYPTGELSYEE